MLNTAEKYKAYIKRFHVYYFVNVDYSLSYFIPPIENLFGLKVAEICTMPYYLIYHYITHIQPGSSKHNNCCLVSSLVSLNHLLTAAKVSSESPIATKGENNFYSLTYPGTRQHACPSHVPVTLRKILT